jgi:hypothetical protein
MFIVHGPLFAHFYFINPYYRSVRVEDEPHHAWCETIQSKLARWWPAGERCTRVAARAGEPIAPSGGNRC